MAKELSALLGTSDVGYLEDPLTTALQVAGRCGWAKTVVALLNAGAAADSFDKDGCTSLWLACEKKHEAAAAELMEATKRAGALYLQGGHEKRSALHLAIHNQLRSTASKLLSLGANAALQDANGKTLWLACKNMREDAAAELMEATKNAEALDLQDNDVSYGFKRSALHWASANGLVSTVAKLMSLGADATLKDQNNQTPVDLAQTEDVKAAFVEHYAQVEITDQNKNALMMLCARLGIASRLPAVLQAGADPAYTENADGKTSLWVACYNKHEAAAAELMEATKRAGALDLQDNGASYGVKRSALHWATANGLGSTVAKLLSLGADATLKENSGEGQIPVDFAPTEDVKAAFVEHYAQVGITNENKN